MMTGFLSGYESDGSILCGKVGGAGEDARGRETLVKKVTISALTH